MKTRLLYAIALAALIAARPLGQQPPEQPPQQPPVFRTEANFVRVDVYATSGGKPLMDLRAEDFELFEDGKPQSINTFEHVVAPAAGPHTERRDPNSVEESRQLAANPRNRVFVIFLDVSHVGKQGGHAIREPIIRFLDRVIGADDLVAVMTPHMAASEITFVRKTEAIAQGLRERPFWGEKRDDLSKAPTPPQDERERLYQLCYPDFQYTENSVGERMIARRRERMTLDALRDLVAYLRHLREERKAIITITEGWPLFRPDQSLLGSGREEVGRGRVGVTPDGRLSTDAPGGNTHAYKAQCDADRLMLANIDDWQHLQDLWGEANRSNASFYTIDPRGLVATVTHGEYLRERAHQDTLRMLAENTDGLSMTTSNDLDGSLRRIADDLQSYYLLGYYSTNTKLDGRFRNIRVRVKRPGVELRARKGYRAATAEEVAAVKTAAAASNARTPPSPVSSAMSALARLRSDSPFHVHAIVTNPSSDGGAVVWVAGEVRGTGAGDAWAKGATADIEVAAEGVSGSGRVTLKPGERAFVTRIALAKPPAGTIDVRAKLTGAEADAAPVLDSLRVEAGAGRGALLFRRGPSTGNRLQAAALPQFSRTERLRIEVPVAAGTSAGTARLLDKAGQPITIPVTMGERTDDQASQRWLTADVTLAPLGAGDYAVEIEAGEAKIVTAIRVVR